MLRQTRWTPVATWSLFVVVAGISAFLVWRRPAWDRLSDLHIYRGAVLAVTSGEPLYQYAADNGGPFTYPPFALLILWPIGWVPEPVVQVLWLVSTCAAVMVLAVAIGRVLARRTESRQFAVAAVAVGLMLTAPVQSNLRFGQISIFIVLLALVDGIGLTPARYRGLLVGVAAAIKLTPLLFVLYFLITGRSRDAARAVAAFLGCAVVGVMVFPSESWAFWTGTMLDTRRIGDLASLGNQSLHGMLMRTGVSPGALPILWTVLVAFICAVGLWRARAIHLEGQPARATVLIGCATIAASPVSWTHHQVWPVLAGMLMLAEGRLRKAAGVLLLLTMALSLSVLLRDVSTTPGLQFLLENGRALAIVAVCLAGLTGTTIVARSTARSRWRIAVTATASLALVAVLPLPAGADPTFKAYTADDIDNPRYFYACHTASECAALVAGAPVGYEIAREPTKVRVNGMVDATVARLEYRSAPGGAARTIPLIEIFPGQRGFSFRSANIAHGALLAYDAAGQPIIEVEPARSDLT